MGGDSMSRLIVHMAVPEPRREVASTMDGLTGVPEEFSVPLETIPDGVSDLWDKQVGYPLPGKYWGASQALAQEICVAMQTSEAAPAADAWFCAVVEDTGDIFQTNVPGLVVGTWEAFLAAAGLKVIESEIEGGQG
jgi:hypothetical protein